MADRKPKCQIMRLLEMDVADIAGLPTLTRRATQLLRFLHRAAGRFVHDQCIQRAAALAYASLLAIVPLVALGVSIFTNFHAFDLVADKIREVLLSNLLPTSHTVVERYLSGIASKTTALSIFGIIGLLVAATALLNTMEEAFNHIWRIARKRPWLSRFAAFWATLTLAPVLIGASITITSYFAALPVLRDVTVHAAILRKVDFLIPWMMSSLALTMLYMALPNTRVPFRFAISGGLIAGALFELTKYGFAFYVTELAHYERLYGALGALPIFLIWLYLTWVVVLMGSEMVFCLQHPEQSHSKNIAFTQPGVQQFFAHLILIHAAEALQDGRMLHMDTLTRATGAPDNILQAWLDVLCKKGLLHAIRDNGTDAWVPGMDAARLHLIKIYDALADKTMCIPDKWRDTILGHTLAGLYFRLERERKDVLADVSIRDLITSEEHEPA